MLTATTPAIPAMSLLARVLLAVSMPVVWPLRLLRVSRLGLSAVLPAALTHLRHLRRQRRKMLPTPLLCLHWELSTAPTCSKRRGVEEAVVALALLRMLICMAVSRAAGARGLLPVPLRFVESRRCQPLCPLQPQRVAVMAMLTRRRGEERLVTRPLLAGRTEVCRRTLSLVRAPPTA